MPIVTISSQPDFSNPSSTLWQEVGEKYKK